VEEGISNYSVRDEEQDEILRRGEGMEEGSLILAPRGFVEDGGGETKKECHFRSHDTAGPASRLTLFLFSARRAPDFPRPLLRSISLLG